MSMVKGTSLRSGLVLLGMLLALSVSHLSLSFEECPMEFRSYMYWRDYAGIQSRNQWWLYKHCYRLLYFHVGYDYSHVEYLNLILFNYLLWFLGFHLPSRGFYGWIFEHLGWLWLGFANGIGLHQSRYHPRSPQLRLHCRLWWFRGHYWWHVHLHQ